MSSAEPSRVPWESRLIWTHLDSVLGLLASSGNGIQHMAGNAFVSCERGDSIAGGNEAAVEMSWESKCRLQKRTNGQMGNHDLPLSRSLHLPRQNTKEPP